MSDLKVPEAAAGSSLRPPHLSNPGRGAGGGAGGSASAGRAAGGVGYLRLYEPEAQGAGRVARRGMSMAVDADSAVSGEKIQVGIKRKRDTDGSDDGSKIPKGEGDRGIGTPSHKPKGPEG